MATVTIQEAQTKLLDLIHGLQPGEELVITEDDQAIAKLTVEKRAEGTRPPPGLCKGMISIVADDDEHLKDFADYMP